MLNDEEWRAVPGYEGLYEVSNTGRVRSINRQTVHNRKDGSRHTQRTPGVLLKQHLCRGYLVVSLCKDSKKKDRYVHHLVLEAHIGERPPGMECRHLNGNRTDNRAANLVWGTRSENIYDSYRQGRRDHIYHPRGQDHGNAKLTDRGVCNIVARIARGESLTKIAKEHDVCVSSISLINRGKSWKHIPREGQRA